MENWTDASVAPVWFDEKKFDDEDFNAIQYVDDLKRYVRYRAFVRVDRGRLF